MDRVIRVLVVDDSAYVRKVVTQMLSKSPFIEVVGTARDGKEALEKVAELSPDVITLDLIMPVMDGVTFLEEQMARKPIPVVVVSIASESGELALRALDTGAVDFIQKPTALATEKIMDMAEELLAKVKAASEVKLSHLITPERVKEITPQVLEREKPPNFDAIVIGVSTGGPQALKLIVPLLPADFPIPIGVVLHMPVGYTDLYAQRLNEISALQVLEAKDGQLVKPGMVIIAQAGKHMLFERGEDGSIYVRLSSRPFDTPHRPSVDVLFRSAAEVFGKRLLGIVLTGMGNDGLQGAAWIKAVGGMVITEAEETCVVYGMPRAVEEAQLSDRVLTIYDMAKAITDLI